MPNFGTRKRKVYHMCTTKWGEKTSISTHFSRLWYILVHKSQSVVHLFRGVPQAKLSFFITLIESFLDMASVPTIRVIFRPQKDCNGCQESLCRNRSVLYNRERTRISTRVSVLKHFRLKRQTYETYLHIITSHLVSVKIW